MPQNRHTVGIAGIGCYIPKRTLTSEEIAEIAGVPVRVLTEKIGMRRKPVADPAEQPSKMALAAATAALQKAGVTPDLLHLIIYAGSAPQDYLLWSAAAKVQHALGATNAFAFEITNGCNGANLGMQIATDMLLGSDAMHYALIVSADKFSPFIDFTIQDDISLFHVADGAAAVVLRKDEPTNRILSYFQITDGSYVDYAKIRSGGTMHPCSSEEEWEKQRFSVENPEELNEVLSEVYLSNYVSVIHTALERCGHTIDEIDFLFTNQVKASTMESILAALGIPPSKTFRSIEDYGHMGTVDTPFALSKALEEQRISPGDLVVLASSATGFSWAAMVLQF